MALRVGIDLVRVQDVADAVRDHGERYLARVFTDDEVADCVTGQGIDTLGLATRFAVKEAAIKVLRAPEGLAWGEIAVLQGPGQTLRVQLAGTAARAAAVHGLDELAVSAGRAAGYASAVIVARGEQ